MPRAGSLTTFSASTLAQASQVNTNFSTVRDALNDYAMWTDYATTVSVTHTYTIQANSADTATEIREVFVKGVLGKTG